MRTRRLTGRGARAHRHTRTHTHRHTSTPNNSVYASASMCLCACAQCGHSITLHSPTLSSTCRPASPLACSIKHTHVLTHTRTHTHTHVHTHTRTHTHTHAHRHIHTRAHLLLLLQQRVQRWLRVLHGRGLEVGVVEVVCSAHKQSQHVE